MAFSRPHLAETPLRTGARTRDHFAAWAAVALHCSDPSGRSGNSSTAWTPTTWKPTTGDRAPSDSPLTPGSGRIVRRHGPPDVRVPRLCRARWAEVPDVVSFAARQESLARTQTVAERARCLLRVVGRQHSVLRVERTLPQSEFVERIARGASCSVLQTGVGMTFPKTISEGDSGPVVRWAQYLLVRRTLSYTQIDGIFGPVTKQAVEQFQQYNLTVDGIVGPATWAALGGDQPEPPILQQGATGNVVRLLQTALNEGRGDFSPNSNPPLVVDGDFGRNRGRSQGCAADGQHPRGCHRRSADVGASRTRGRSGPRRSVRCNRTWEPLNRNRGVVSRERVTGAR